MSAKEKRARAKERRRQEEERRRAQAEQQARRARRRRVVTMTSAVAVLVIIAVAVGVFVQRQRGLDEGPAPSGAVANGTAIAVGDADAPVTLALYEDFRCPACAKFEETYGATIDELVDDGTVRVEYHLATIIDSFGQEGSKVAGNAAACAQDAGGFREYHATLFDHQPDEQTDGFTVERVLELAKDVQGLDTASFQQCVEDERYRPWLRRAHEEMVDRFDNPVTPTMLVDGTLMYGGPDSVLDPKVKTADDLARTARELAGS